VVRVDERLSQDQSELCAIEYRDEIGGLSRYVLWGQKAETTLGVGMLWIFDLVQGSAAFMSPSSPHSCLNREQIGHVRFQAVVFSLGAQILPKVQ
jgi:hypothetical protein